MTINDNTPTKKFRVFVPLSQWNVYEVQARSETSAIESVLETQHGRSEPLKVIQINNGETVFAECKED